MVQIDDFAVESWMDRYENQCKYNIAETCCASISISQLREISDDKQTDPLSNTKKLTYGAIRGSDALRSNLARLYSAKGNPLPFENIITTPGAIFANYLCYYALIGPGDHVIVHYPTYQSLYDVPKQLGATVSLWRALPSNNWIPDLSDLKQLIRPNTKMIVINNPNNPTGAVLKKSLLEEILTVAKDHNLYLLSDEVYRPIFHSITPADPGFPPSLISMDYEKAIVTGSMSKAYALAGIRVGWIASRSREIIELIAQARHFTTISVSQLDEQVAAFALSQPTVHNLLARNITLAKKNLALLERFILKNDDAAEWVKPLAGTTAFVKFHRDGKAVDSVDFCERVLDKTGVMFVPGDDCFGKEWRGYVRIGFVNETEIVSEGLDRVTKFLRKELDEVKLSE